MAKTPEVKVKDKVKKLLKEVGAYYAQPVMMGMASNGTPDILVCWRGYFAGVEVKAGKGKPTKLQMARLEEIVAAGGTALVINENNIDSLRTWLKAPYEPANNLEEWV